MIWRSPEAAAAAAAAVLSPAGQQHLYWEQMASFGVEYNQRIPSCCIVKIVNVPDHEKYLLIKSDVDSMHLPMQGCAIGNDDADGHCAHT